MREKYVTAAHFEGYSWIHQELDQIETKTDEQQTVIRSALFEIEKTLDPIDAMFLYEVISLTGEVADMSERVGRRLELLLSN